MSHRDVISRFLDAALGGDDATVAALMHPDFFITEADSLPYGGTYHGLAGLKQMLERLRSCVANHTVVLREIIGGDDSDQFGILVDMSGTIGGQPFTQSIFERWILRDGKVAEIWPYYWDTAAISSLGKR